MADDVVQLARDGGPLLEPSGLATQPAGLALEARPWTRERSSRPPSPPISTPMKADSTSPFGEMTSERMAPANP